jgi:hypothetical protein
LKVEGTINDDSGKNDETPTDNNNVYGAIVDASKSALRSEEDLRESFAGLVELQHELEEDVRFTRGSVNSLAVKDGSGEDGLWQTVRLWQSFADQRLMGRQNELQREFQEKLQEFLKKDKGILDDELPRYVLDIVDCNRFDLCVHSFSNRVSVTVPLVSRTFHRHCRRKCRHSKSVWPWSYNLLF